MRTFRIALAVAAALSLSMAALAETPAIGAAAPDFQLTTLDGKPFSLSQATGSQNAVVLIFIATKCPYSNAYNERMRDMAAAYASKGVLFVGYSNRRART